MKVFDRNTPSSTGLYTVAGLQGDLPAEYGVGERDFAQASQRIELNNIYSNAGQPAGNCHFHTTLHNIKTSSADASRDAAHQQRAVLFMLIAE